MESTGPGQKKIKRYKQQSSSEEANGAQISLIRKIIIGIFIVGYWIFFYWFREP